MEMLSWYLKALNTVKNSINHTEVIDWTSVYKNLQHSNKKYIILYINRKTVSRIAIRVIP